MTRPIVKKCIDCSGSMNHSNHHFRCNKCWFKNKMRLNNEIIDFKIKLKPLNIKK